MKRSTVCLSSLVTLFLTLSIAQIGGAAEAEQAGETKEASAESAEVEAKLVYYAIPW